ncbi:N-acyl-D-amino-acid deacylase [Streptomyces glaucescens]
MEDLVIRDADVVDGTGAPSYRADVVVDGGRIVSIVKEAAAAGCQRPTAMRELDAEGLVLSPGFIDMHAHSDLALLRDPDHSAKAAQGVTLEVIGQDGLSYAPVDDRTLAEVRRAITGWNGSGDDIDFDWRSVGEYLDRLDGGIAVNAAYLIPQGTVRALAVGWEDREATPRELDRMRQLVAEGLEQGAVGMSSGLTYTPGMYAKDAELTELCRVVASYGGYYCPHHRSYGAGALAAYEEMVALTREAGCALHLAHATMNFGVNKGRAPELLALLDEALAAGADISLDTYPYTPGCTTLAALLPSWASEGGPEAALKRLTDPETAERIRHHMEVVGADGCHGVPVEWETIEISGVTDPALGEYVGRTVRESADARGEAPWTVAHTGCWWRTGWGRRSSSTSATRRTSGRSCGTASTPAARTASSRAPSRIRARTAPSRTISAGTSASWACCRWRSASPTSPRARRPGCGCRTGAWCARGTAPTWCCSTRRPSRPGRRTTVRAPFRRASRTSWSTGGS